MGIDQSSPFDSTEVNAERKKRKGREGAHARLVHIALQLLATPLSPSSPWSSPFLPIYSLDLPNSKSEEATVESLQLLNRINRYNGAGGRRKRKNERRVRNETSVYFAWIIMFGYAHTRLDWTEKREIGEWRSVNYALSTMKQLFIRKIRPNILLRRFDYQRQAKYQWKWDASLHPVDSTIKEGKQVFFLWKMFLKMWVGLWSASLSNPLQRSKYSSTRIQSCFHPHWSVFFMFVLEEEEQSKTSRRTMNSCSTTWLNTDRQPYRSWLLVGSSSFLRLIYSRLERVPTLFFFVFSPPSSLFFSLLLRWSFFSVLFAPNASQSLW